MLRESETVIVGRSERLGISNAKIGAKHLECRLTLSPVVAVELRASEVVYVKDRFGVLKKAKANFIGYLKMGEVLYLCALTNKLPQYGYISSLKACLRRERLQTHVEMRSQPPLMLPTGEGKDCILISSMITVTAKVGRLIQQHASNQQSAIPARKERRNANRLSPKQKMRERGPQKIHVSCCPPMMRLSSRNQIRKARRETTAQQPKRVAEALIKRQQGEVRADVEKRRQRANRRHLSVTLPNLSVRNLGNGVAFKITQAKLQGLVRQALDSQTIHTHVWCSTRAP